MVYRDPIAAQEKFRRMVRRRRRERRAKLASLVVLVLVVVGAGAIGIDRAVVFARHLFPEHHHRRQASSSATTSGPTTTTIPGPPRCGSGQISVYLYNWEISGGVFYEDVAVENTSEEPCTLAGYVELSVAAPGGGTLPAPVHEDSALGSSAGASSTAPVAVSPGQRAWFEFSYPVDCAMVLSPGQTPSGAPGQCYRGAVLEVLVPQANSPLEVTQPLSFTYGTAGFNVGPFGSGTPPAAPPVG